MNCPVCERSLAPTLSICPTCGAMMNDTVREELQTKISSGNLPRVNLEARAELDQRPSQSETRSPVPPPVRNARPSAGSVPPPVKRQETGGLKSPKTSPTLVEFQNKNASLPDWRIQLQNAVQQRKGGHVDLAKADPKADIQFTASGNVALKAEVVQRVEPATVPEISDPRVASAMRRIEESRRAFMAPQPPKKRFAAPKPAQLRPFGLVSPSGSMSAAVAPAPVTAPPKPMLVNPMPAPAVAEKRDTNKLPPIDPLPNVEIAKPIIERVEKIDSGPLTNEFAEIKRIHIKAESTAVDSPPISALHADEIEDLAPFSMRFGAGLFDLIIGSFTSMLMLSPLAFIGDNWFTPTGLLAFTGTGAIVMFVYMTLCLGFFGKTMGMRLFSLELVDAVENEYPTLRQAAINSFVFILTLPLAGAGFLTVFFNEENRAAHDLLSGTILVREF